jgi:hypothetical protein
MVALAPCQADWHGSALQATSRIWLGGVSYQSKASQVIDLLMFTVINSDASFTFRFYHWNLPFTTIVAETVGNETKKLLRKDLTNYHLPLYRALGADKP